MYCSSLAATGSIRLVGMMFPGIGCVGQRIDQLPGHTGEVAVALCVAQDSRGIGRRRRCVRCVP